MAPAWGHRGCRGCLGGQCSLVSYLGTERRLFRCRGGEPGPLPSSEQLALLRCFGGLPQAWVV